MNKKIIFVILVAIFILMLAIGIKVLLKKNENLDIERYVSSEDRDQDGVDDQTDILNSAKNYVKSKPEYKSKWYSSGYPDDKYGVCTDVVGFALLGAGYDIMEMLNADVVNNLEVYKDIETPQKTIDFRRVKNLSVFFNRNFLSLTTDIKDYKNWQGGDIVVFKKHIGIISDKRDLNGIPYVIHHAPPLQLSYEEDILSGYMYGPIIGHYRIN